MGVWTATLRKAKNVFDTAKSKISSRAFQIFRIYWNRLDLRRVTAILLQKNNFGPNVVYFVLGAIGRNFYVGEPSNASSTKDPHYTYKTNAPIYN